MNVIVGLTGILEAGVSEPEKYKDIVRALNLSAQQLMVLINDLLDMSKIEDSSFRLENIRFDLKQVVGDVVDMYGVEAHKKGVALEYDYGSGLPVNFMGDPVRLRQIVMNLIGNAMKFTKEGFIRVEVEEGKGAKDGAPFFAIHVRDTGIGIAKDKLETIFQRFMQADSTITRKYGGTGLGLSICKSLTEMMGGKISVESDIGKGAHFTVEIPLSPCADDVRDEEQKTEELKTAPRDAAKKCVLLVEDYAPNVLVAGMILEGFGYSYDVAADGKQAIEKMKKGGVDIVLMDVQMPEMDGFSATRLWRETEVTGKEGKRLPIIGMTAHASDRDKDRCLQAGMDDYIAKPFDTAELREKIAALLSRTEQAS